MEHLPLIELDRLTKRFATPDGLSVLAVDRLSLSVAPGEIYALLGPNGAGKTTTLRMLIGLIRPTSGAARVAGFDVTRQSDEVKRRVGLLSSHAGLYQRLTPREMLLFFADVYGLTPGRARERLRELAELLQMGEFLERPCGTLSTGQRQRVSLARSLIHDPPALLLDEPTVGLDVMTSQVVVEFIAHARASGKAVMLCTHYLDEAQRIASRFGMLNRGRLVAEGTLAELREQTGCENLVAMFLKLADVEPMLRVRERA